MMTTRQIASKVRLMMIDIERQIPIERDNIRNLFGNINEVLVLGDQTKYNNVALQFRVLEINEMLRFLSSLPFESENLLTTLKRHLSICLDYRSVESGTPVQESLADLHSRILKLPSIYPDYFGFAMAKIKEIIPSAVQSEELEKLQVLLPRLLPPHSMVVQTLPHNTEKLCIIQDEVKQLCEILSNSTSKILNSLIPHLHSICLCYEEYSAMLEKHNSAIQATAQLSGVGLGFFEIDMTVALRLVSRTATGGENKTNRHGTHAVCQCEGVFYKPNPVGRAEIAPEKEFAIYALYNLLQNNGVAPVALTKIHNVIFNRPDESENIKYERVMQASFGVNGILLLDVISMANIPTFLRNCLGNQNAEALFESLFTQTLDTDEILASRPGLPSFDALEKMSSIDKKAEVLAPLYDEVMEKLPVEKRCFEFKQIPSGRNTFREFCANIDAASTCRYLLETLWVIKQYPDICVHKQGETSRPCYFGEITYICKYLHQIKALFPNLTSKEVMLELDSVLSKFNKEQYSVHFLVTLLSNPCDHKADNLMVIFDQDKNGKIQTAKLIGIDNDLAFDEEGRTKTFVYLIQNMHDSFHSAVLQRLMKLTPEIFILDWLIALEEQNERYRDYIAQDVLTDNDFNENGRVTLNIPFQLDSSIIPNMYQKLKKLLQFLEISKDASHWEILSHVQPGVSEAYKQASNSFELLDHAFQQIPWAFGTYKGVETLSGITESPAEAVLSFIQSIDISSFDEVAQVHVIGKILRFFPGQSNSLQIPGEARDIHSRRNFFLLAVEHGYCALVARMLVEEKMAFLKENRKKLTFSLLEQKSDEKTPFLIACTHANLEMIKLLISYGCDTLVRDNEGKSCLILLINCLAQNPMDASAALKLLGEYSNIPWNSGWGKNMTKPLHSLVDLYAQVPDIVLPFFVFFIEKGASPDLVDHNGNSPLDFAMQNDFVEVVRALIEHGAGRTVNISVAEEFFHKNAMKDLYSDLIRYSLLLRWNLALQCLKTNSTSSGIFLEGTQVGKMFLSSTLAADLFDDKRDIRCGSSYGRRNVNNIKIKDNEGVCYELYFKQNPELPGLEFAVDILFELLIGHGTSYTDLAKITHPSGKCYPVLISQGIQGENLHDVLKEKEKSRLLEKLNEQSFSELLIASLLVNFEDAKPDNFILEELPDGSFRLVGIDNDHAFVPPVAKKDLLVKCILYCMDNMKSPIHPKAREKFLSFDPERILTLWLDRLATKQDEYFELFPTPKKRKIFGGNKNKALSSSTSISIPFQKGTIGGIYQKFKRIQNCLRGSKNVTGMLLLRTVIPELGIRYEQTFRDENTPMKRFLALVETQYSVAMNGRCGTLMNSRQILKSMKINTKDLESEKIGPRVAIQELEDIKKEIDAAIVVRKQIQTELGKGDVSSFQNLILDTEKEKVINGVVNEFPPLNFSEANENGAMSQANFAKTVLCGGNYCSLHIHQTRFSTSLLRQIIRSSPQLVSLELYKCHGVDAALIKNLRDSLCLSSLQLIDLQDINGTVELPFRLRSLEIAHCQGIVTLKFPDTLKQLTLDNCRNLESFTVHSISNGKFKRKEESAARNYKIEKLTLKACIKHNFWRVFTTYLKEDLSHFLYFENMPFSLSWESLLYSLPDIKTYPEILMVQDICRCFQITFATLWEAVFKRFHKVCEGKHNLHYFMLDYADALTRTMQEEKSPELRLNDNLLSGNIPSELGQLSSLVGLHLNNNQLSGIIPLEIVQLSSLVHLQLNNNQLSGIIPLEIVQLSSLVHLQLNNNQLSGIIPPELAQISSLAYLELNNNQLSGNIPLELCQLSSLQRLQLNNNQLSGNIPLEICQLSSLQRIQLNNNQLSGNIPPTISQLSSLTELQLNDNQLSENIPPEIGQLSSLQQLYLNNNQLTGNIPPEIGQLSSLKRLYLNDNQLSGNIPPTISQLSSLTELQLNDNQLSEIIPPEIGQLSSLQRLRLNNNQLSGNIPPKILQLKLLKILYLNNNQLTGDIPEIGNLPFLAFLNLNNNQLTGNIPPQIGLLSSLQQLHLDNNQLSGNIPDELGFILSFRYLHLNNNQLSGNIPLELGQLPHLVELQLNNNQLTGNIPPELCQLPSLECLQLNDNQLSGNIPPKLDRLVHLKRLYLNNNQLTGNIPPLLAQLASKNKEFEIRV